MKKNEGLWEKVNKTDTCWLWTGKKSRSGGRFGQGGYGMYADRMAHRVIYELVVGAIPEGLQLDHLCGTTSCVNPDHLEPVTPEENIRRHAAKRTHCHKGHEFTPENTRYRYGQGRRCRACVRENTRRYNERRAAA